MLKDNWKLWWSFKNSIVGTGSTASVTDDTGLGHTLSYVSGEAMDIVPPGKPDKSMQFQTLSDRYWRTPDTADLTFWNGSNDLPFSICFWIYPVTITPPTSMLISKRDGASGFNTEYTVSYLNSRNIEFTLCKTNDNTHRIRIITTGPATTLNTWTQIVCTYDGTQTSAGMKIYVNGILNSTITQDSGTYVGMQNSSAAVYLGSQKNSGASTLEYQGLLDSIGIRSSITTEAEALQLWNSGFGLNPLDARTQGILTSL